MRRETKDFAQIIEREFLNRFKTDDHHFSCFFLRSPGSPVRLIHTSSLELNIFSERKIHSTGDTDEEISIALEIDLLRDTEINSPSTISIHKSN
jgi:hypothetical protein